MVEFSIVTCSVDDAKFASMKQCYEQVLSGESFEIIRINDAKGMCEGYNRGIPQCSGQTIILSHDDASPVRPFAAKLRAHLRSVDIVGGAGTNRLAGPVWFSEGVPHTFGQVLNRIPSGDLLLSIFGVPAPLVTGIQAIDGFWMAAHRSVLRPDRAWFDAKTIQGFHFYDLDFSLAANRKGLRIGVASDLNLLHASTGGYNEKWKAEIPPFMEKWAGKLAPQRVRQQTVTPPFSFAGFSTKNLDEACGVMDEIVGLTK